MTTLPTIHINGTGAETLRAEYEAIYDAVRRAEYKLSMATCNARDFYPQGSEAYRAANLERNEMLARLGDVIHYAAAWHDHAQAHCHLSPGV